MATSTFYDKIVLDEKAAGILLKGLNDAKLPQPVSHSREELERRERLLEQYRINLERALEKQTKS